MRGEIEALQKRLGVTTVYVTHDQVEAMTMGDQIAVLRDGLLQQVGHPTDVYDKPANLFVAGFIGSPPMNLAQATIASENGRLVAKLGETAISIPEEVAKEQGLENWRDKMVILGIRPEDLHQSEGEAGSNGAKLPATIDRIEALGASLLVHFAVDAPPAKTAGIAAATGEHGLDEVPLIGHGGAWFSAAFAPRSGVRTGNQVDVAVDTRRLHFFDPETEVSVRSDSKS
jgi:multiple sugar transport system ATP-binding protein